SIAVPGFNGFVGEFLILVGSFPSQPTLVAFATVGVVLAAGYILWMVKRVFYGESRNPKNEGLVDLDLREAAVILPLGALAVVTGVARPQCTKRIEPTVEALVQQVQQKTRPVEAATLEEGRK